jgi:hypothetical protein
MQRIILIALLCFIALPAWAQDNTENGVAYGGRVNGQLNNAVPRAVYYFDGLRGEVVSISLKATSGNLDPVLTVVDSGGRTVAALDDAKGNRDIVIDALRIPQSSRYYVIIGRFGYSLGSTAGAYELDVERIGVSSDSGSALRYGDTVINNITNMAPQIYYSFRAKQGDIVGIHMTRDSGDLDTYLQVVDSNALVIAENDDVPGQGTSASGIDNLLIKKDGTYIIVATRYGEASGTSSGRFILSIQQAPNSGIGNSVQAAIPIQVGATALDGELTDTEFTRYYTFDAKRNDLIAARMTRTNGSLQPLLILANAGIQELTTGAADNGELSAKIDTYLIPADGTYYLVATRVDQDQGTTFGRYKIELQSLGNAFDGVPPGTQRISYGTTVTGRIDAQTPEVLFAFYGVQGEPITVSVNRGDGDLDPSVSILSSDQKILANDDDGGGGQNARIARYVVPKTGTYYIKAYRFNGTDGNPNTQGSFVLVLARLAR